MAAPAPADDERCRSILADLLTPIDTAAAAGWADRLIDAFGSVGGVLAQSRDHVRAITDDRVGRLTSATGAAIAHALRERLQRRPLNGADRDLIAYLVATMADLDHEQLRVLFLDRGNRLIRDETVARGAVARMTIYPRTVLRRAIALNASAMILVHNHPGGSAEPSTEDIEGTRQIVSLGGALDIAVHDHLIVAGSSWVSLHGRGIL